MALVIRTAKPKDANALAHMEAEVWRDAYPALVPDRYLTVTLAPERRRGVWRRRLMGAERSRTVVALDGDSGETAGYATYGPSRWPLLPFGGEIYELYLRPDHRGRGHGRTLCVWIAERFQEVRIASACVEVLAGNHSRFFYETLGGRLVAHSAHTLAGVRLPTVIYGWDDVRALARATAQRN